MQNELYSVVSLPASNFTEALAQNAASAMNNLVGLRVLGCRRFVIRAIGVETMENFGPEFDFFATAAGRTLDPITDTWISRWAFSASMGVQLSAAGLWRYYIDGLSIPYFDLDTTNSQNAPTVHVTLQNTEATAKSAGVPGAIKATFWMEPLEGW